MFYFQIAYMVFLLMYTYVCLVKMPPAFPSWPEVYVTACIVSFGMEALRTLFVTEANSLKEKLRVWLANSKWNLFDTFATITFMAAFCLRYIIKCRPIQHKCFIAF